MFLLAVLLLAAAGARAAADDAPLAQPAHRHKPARAAANGLVAYVSNVTGELQIWGSAPDGSGAVQLTSAAMGVAAAAHPSFSPNGSVMAFSAAPPGGSQFNIWLLHLPTRAARQLTHCGGGGPGAQCIVPAFTADGRRVAPPTRSPAAPRRAAPQLYSVDASTGGDLLRLTTTPAGRSSMGGKPSPDGRWLAYASDADVAMPAGLYDLYVAPVGPRGELVGPPRRLTRGAANQFSRGWAPDSKAVTFNSQVGWNATSPGAGRIMVVRRDGSGLRALTAPNGAWPPLAQPFPQLRGDVTPAWSPDGARVAFASQSPPDGAFQVVSVRASEGGGRVAITANPGALHASLTLAANLFTGAVPEDWAALARLPPGAIDLRDNPCMPPAELAASVATAGLGGVVRLGALDGGGSSRPAALLLAAVAALLLAGTRGVAGQGLGVSPDQLGEGEAATASQFEVFEDALALAAQSTGGRGNGGRGGTNVGSSAFTDADRLRTLQTGVYYLAGAAEAFGTCRGGGAGTARRGRVPRRATCNAFVPPPRDQKECSTCVSTAVATAMQMAAATALQQDVRRWEVNPASLHYCSAGGRTCRTGWDIQLALNAVVDEAPQLIRPASCVRNVSAMVDAELQGGVTSWRDACAAASRACARESSKEQPYVKCSYKSLSNFWEIQQHIRNHGAVVSRISIYDDWEVQFNASAGAVRGEEWPAYRYNATARPLFGHAVTIVGYNNSDYTWLGLNSWGGATKTQVRTKGFTADGLFRIKMGVAAVGTPDETYGLECTPVPGAPQHDPHSTQPWRVPRPVELLDPVRDTLDLRAPCVGYRVARGDTLASIVDSFGIDMRRFVQRDNAALWPRQNVSYTLGPSLTDSELGMVLATAKDVLAAPRAPRPYAACTHYDASGAATRRTCDAVTGPAACGLGRGTVGCALHFTDANLTRTPALGTRLAICRASQLEDPAGFYAVAAFADREVAQVRALLGLVQAVAPDYTPPAEAARLRWWTCGTSATAQDATKSIPLQAGSGDELVLSAGVGDFSQPFNSSTCGTLGVVKSVEMVIFRNPPSGRARIAFTPALLAPLLSLRGSLAALLLGDTVGSWELPPQLGSLAALKMLALSHPCFTGSLPANWMDGGWRSTLTALYVSPSFGGTTAPGCGVTGTIPEAWLARPTALQELMLLDQRLSGKLPPSMGRWRRLESLLLTNNTFSGLLSPEWSQLRSLSTLWLDGNRLTGAVPASWAALQNNLGYLDLSDNAGLSGCLPFDPPFVDSVERSGTAITGACNNEGEAAQWRALNTTLRDVLLSGADASVHAVFDRMLAQLRPLSSALADGDKMLTYSAYGEPPVGDGPMPWYISVDVQRVDNGVGVVGINAFGEQFFGIHTSLLPKLAAVLSDLQYFRCRSCRSNSTAGGPARPADTELPPGLPAAAPKLKVLQLPDSALRGTLPPEWGRGWALEHLELTGNAISGSLPAAWKDLASLTTLDLSINALQGSLPPEWGEGVLPPSAWISVSQNAGLNGTVPASWARFQGSVSVMGTAIDGCAPGGLDVHGTTGQLPSCSDPERSALDALQALLTNASLEHGAANNQSLASWFVKPAYSYQIVFPHCDGWAGVACDATSRRVTSLDLSGLGLRLAPLALEQVTSLAAQLPSLRSLVLAGLGLGGSLDAAAADLVTLAALETLNVSGNPELGGGLPTKLARRLRVLRAAGTRVSGSVPPSWGILAALEELDLRDAALSGPLLPGAWAEPAAASAAAQRALAAAGEPPPGGARGAASAGVGGGAAAAASAGPLMAALRVLRLAGNDLTGGLPDELNTFPSLRVVEASRNLRLGGRLPPALAHLRGLTELHAAGCGLSGPLPFAWASLTNLTRLDVSANALTGTLVPEYGGLVGLRQLTLAANLFTGAVPEDWAALARLPPGAIDLRDNPCMPPADLAASIRAQRPRAAGARRAAPPLPAPPRALAGVPGPAPDRVRAPRRTHMPRPNAADRRRAAEASATLERAAAAPDLAAYEALEPAMGLLHARTSAAWEQWQAAPAPDPAGFAPDPVVLRVLPLLGRAEARGLALLAEPGGGRRSWQCSLSGARMAEMLLEALTVHVRRAAFPRGSDKAELVQQLREQGLLSALVAAAGPLAAELEHATRELEEQQLQLKDHSGLQPLEDTSGAVLRTWAALAEAEATTPSAVLVAQLAQLAPPARLAAASLTLHGRAVRAGACSDNSSAEPALTAVHLITGIICMTLTSLQHMQGGRAGSELVAALDIAVADRHVQFVLFAALAACAASKAQQEGDHQARSGSGRQQPEALAAAVGRLQAALGLEGLEGLLELQTFKPFLPSWVSVTLLFMLGRAAIDQGSDEGSLASAHELRAWVAAAVGVLVQGCVLAPDLLELNNCLRALVAAVRVAGREAGPACLGDAQAARLLPGALLSRLQRATAEERAQGLHQRCAASLLQLLMEMCRAGPTKAALLAELAEQPGTAAAGAEAALRTATDGPALQLAAAVCLSHLCTQPCGLQPTPALAALLTTALKVAAARAGGDSDAQAAALAVATQCAAAAGAEWLAASLPRLAEDDGAAAVAGQASSSASGLGARLLPPAVLAPLAEQAAAASDVLAAAPERLQAAGPGSGYAAAQLAVLRVAVGPALAAQLAALGGAVSGALPLRSACSNPGCANLAGLSEAALVKGTHHLCAACRVARVCGPACHKAYWRAGHKAVCKRLQAEAEAAGGAGYG
ncbi:MSL1 [Scenedesmus sp. PABB004]|nr:MSL1 [Scenedesmus sp. PABB004]